MDGCLLRNPSLIGFTDYMRMMKEDPLTARLEEMIPSYTGEGRIEEFLDPKEIKRLQEQFGLDAIDEHRPDQLITCD